MLEFDLVVAANGTILYIWIHIFPNRVYKSPHIPLKYLHFHIPHANFYKSHLNDDQSYHLFLNHREFFFSQSHLSLFS